MLTGLAHTAVCVADVDEAVRWYSEVLGMQVLSPPYLMEGPEIEFDMGELIPSPVAVKAAIVGFAVAGLRTCWFVDPNGVVFIMMEKSKADRPYYRQY
jgi:catechol 2,3-dioxygenase-like lactoylglutathione lyase family enzyme